MCLGIEEDFIAWKTKLFELLSNDAGRDGVKSCSCGRDDTTAGSCRRSRSDNTTGVDHSLTVSEDAEVGPYIVWQCVYHVMQHVRTTAQNSDSGHFPTILVYAEQYLIW